MELVLQPMSAGDFDRRIADLRRRYADHLGVQRGLRPDAAEAETARQIAELLPQGLHTGTAILRVARVGGADVGWVWVAGDPALRELGLRGHGSADGQDTGVLSPARRHDRRRR